MEIKPPIWRRLEVPSNIGLSKLHSVFQVAMGWTDTHLHQFEASGIRYGVPDPDFDEDARDERRYKLSQIAPDQESSFFYEYDFGDGWRHKVTIERVHQTEGIRGPTICLAGRRGCPPEDCGGPWGYREMLEAWVDPAHPEHSAIREWAGEYFDPEAFDLDEVNGLLRRLR